MQQTQEQFVVLHYSTSCINYKDVANADIAGANICPCSRRCARNDNLISVSLAACFL